MRNASYSVNIGSAIETRSDTSINIGYNIKSIHPRGYQTINIGRNITNNASDMSVSGNNAIAIGENISITNAPYSISIGSNIVYGRRYTGSQRYHNDDAIVIGHSNDTSNYPWIPANPFSVLTEASYRNAGFWIPKRSTGSGATYSPAFNLLYIDAVGNAFFGVQTMSHAGSIPTLYAPPSAGDPANGIPPNAISGRVYARDFYSLGGQTTWTPSDRRLKRNIKPLSRDYTDYLYRLRPFSYNYDLEGVDPEKIVWGFMAQDVQRWFPHLVEGTEETSMSLNYSGFIPILWKINQDQQIKLDEQQARIEELERQIETINYFLEEIKEKLK
jgi:hypothetical protein